jgi:hypothetical protein
MFTLILNVDIEGCQLVYSLFGRNVSGIQEHTTSNVEYLENIQHAISVP